MTEAESDHIIKEVKRVFDELTKYSEEAQSDSFLRYYDHSLDFLHFSADGKMRGYEEFKKICTEYYDALEYQKILTISRMLKLLDANLVIVGWTGDIIAHFKNGDSMNMNNYSVTNVFKKIGDKWKIIHSHESSVPPEIIKKE